MSGDYKLYCIGPDGHIEKRHDYKTSDDLAALERAKEICGPHEVEVWEGARFVARVKADGTASMTPPEDRTRIEPQPCYMVRAWADSPRLVCCLMKL